MPDILSELRLQARNHIGGVYFANVQRFQVDQDASAVQRGVGPIHADERRQTVHRGILQNHLRQLLLFARHLSERHGLRAFRDSLDHTRVLNGEESFRNFSKSRMVTTNVATATSNVAVCRPSTHFRVLS